MLALPGMLIAFSSFLVVVAGKGMAWNIVTHASLFLFTILYMAVIRTKERQGSQILQAATKCRQMRSCPSFGERRTIKKQFIPVPAGLISERRRESEVPTWEFERSKKKIIAVWLTEKEGIGDVFAARRNIGGLRKRGKTEE